MVEEVKIRKEESNINERVERKTIAIKKEDNLPEKLSN